MNSRKLAEALLMGEKPERPLFCPAIYEHKARLIGVSVSQICADTSLLEAACIAEWEKYRPDMLTVGVDIYNVEAEIIGAKVCCPQANDAVPHLEKPLIADLDNFNYPPITDIYCKGRADVFVNAAARVAEQIGSEVMVRGSVSGAYSIAAALMGIEPAIMATFCEGDKFEKLLDYCLDIAIMYGAEYAKRGLGICMFDSQATPPLVSPADFEKLVLPRVQKFADAMKVEGAEVLEYVAGGNTTQIARSLVKSGFDIILSDFPSDVSAFIEAAKNTAVITRRNISPVLIENGVNDELRQAVCDVKELAAKNENIIIGTGVISYNVEPQNIIEIRRILTQK